MLHYDTLMKTCEDEMFLERFRELSSIIHNCTFTNIIEQIPEQEALEFASQLIQEIKDCRKKIYLMGNKGCASIASYVSAELIHNFEIPAICLFDSPLAFSKSVQEKDLFSQPCKVHLTPHDLLIVISCSGKSKNLISSIEVAKEKKAKIITFTGFSPTNPIRFLGDLNFWFECNDYTLVEMAHMFYLQSILKNLKANKEETSEELQPL